jgi:hypothetical protein
LQPADSLVPEEKARIPKKLAIRSEEISGLQCGMENIIIE